MDEKTEAGELTDEDGLAVVLTITADDLGQHLEEAKAGLENAEVQASQLEGVRARLSRFTDQEVETASPEPALRIVSAPPNEFSWSELRASAEKRLQARGTDLSDVDLDDLLDPVEVERIEERFWGGLRLEANLDRYDVCAAVGAGLTAALVDFLVVRIPNDTIFRQNGLRDQFTDRGSPLTKWMQSGSLPHDNPLSKLCKVPFDRVNLKETGQELPGSGGRTHRYHTLGHDPLLGLVFGTLDIIRGGLSGVDRDGRLVQIPGLAPPQTDPFLALLTEIAHLFSDGATTMGLPPPGWNLTGILQWGNLGPDDLTVGQAARQMYVAGYDSRHFLTMATAPAAAELVLRGYWGLRWVLDERFAEDLRHAGRVSGAERVGDHPRFQALSLIAHLIGSAANAGKIAVYQNPLALNYAEWLAFIGSLLRFSRTKMRSPTDVLIGHSGANLEALAEGWPQLAWDPGSPSMVPEVGDRD